MAARNEQPEGKCRQGPRHCNVIKNVIQEGGSQRKTCPTSQLSSPEISLVRPWAIPTTRSEIAQEEGRVLDPPVPGRGIVSVTILLRPLGALNEHHRQELHSRKRGPMLGEGTSVTISLRQRAFSNREKKSLCSCTLFPRFIRGRGRRT